MLLIAGLTWAIGLHSWFGRQLSNEIIETRHAQVMLIGMSFLQLSLALPLPRLGRVSAWLTRAGGAIYGSGQLLSNSEGSFWLIISISGALVTLVGLASLLRASIQAQKWKLSAALGMFCLGLLLEVITGSMRFGPEGWNLASMGAGDGLRLRMLRLAAISFFALPAITLLFHRLADADPRSRAARWGWPAILSGAIGIPIILALASATRVELRLALSAPANALFAGALAGNWLARRDGRPLERWGWILLSLGMGSGLLMGIYAFDGPIPSPQFIGDYNDVARRSIRLAHAYCVVFGLAGIFLSRELEGRSRPYSPRG
jgi:hypothetical protein